MREVLSLMLALLLFVTMASAEPGLHIYFLDVGQGDSTVITCDGETMMIDGGPSSASQYIYSFLRNTLQIDYIDTMIATHPHADHVGGLAAALNACAVGVVYTPEMNYDSRAWQSVLEYADAQGTPVIIPYPGDEFDIGGATVQILGPIWYHNDLNNLSIVVKITYGETTFLFMGDAEAEAEYDLLDAGVDVKADVLRTGHHGSDTSTTQAFLDAVQPAWAIISVGRDNTYGHPCESTLEKLSGINVLRTDENGMIECISDGQDLWFHCEK